MRVLVCGGRNYSDYNRVCAALDAVARKHKIECIIHGGALGADALAEMWCESRGQPMLEFPADWKTEGFAAGPKRNQRMLDNGRPDSVVAFPGGRGTADMVGRAKAAGLPVWEVA